MMLMFAGVFVVAVVILSGVMRTDPPKQEAKKEKKKAKKTKAEKVAAKAAKANKKQTAAALEKDAEDKARAERKREKERARKAAKKAAAAAEKEAAAAAAVAAEAKAAAAAEAKDSEEPSTSGKKKKKKKKKAKAAPAPVEETVPEVTEAAEPADEGWIEIVTTRKAKEVVEEVADEDPKFSDDIVIGQEHFAMIIGSGGSTLQKIQEATGANVDLPKRGGVRTQTIITGPTKEAVAMAKTALNQLVVKGYSEITHAGHVDEGIEVPSRSLGVVIGPGGQTIKLLQAKTGTKINTPDRDSDSNFVTVVGDPEGVKNCITAIKQIITQGFSSITHEGWIRKTVEVAKSQIGNLIGPGGATIKALQSSTKTRIDIPSGREDPIVVSISGDAVDVASAAAQIAAMLVPPEPEEIPHEWTKEAVEAMDLTF